MEFPSHQSFSSALTESWNDIPFRGSGDNNNLCGSNQDRNQPTCHLCPNIVSLNLQGDSTSSREDSIKRSMMLKNLCSHMGIKSDDIPNECPRLIFPLCVGCEISMSQLWKLQEKLERIGLHISNIVGSIEDSVVEDYIIHLGIDRQLNQGVLHLKEKILEGRRKKLLVKKHQGNLVMRNNGAAGPSSSSSLRSIAQGIRDEEDFVTTDSAGISSDSSTPRLRREDTQEMHGMTDDGAVEHNENPINNLESSSSPSPSTSIQRQGCEYVPETSGDEEQEDIMSWIGEDAAEAAVSVVQDGDVTAGCSPSVEQKPLINEPVDDDDGLFAVVPRKRRLLCEGMEIFKCTGSRFGTRKNYLQCGMCNHTLTILKNRMGKEATSLEKMKKHIRNAHKNEIARKNTARKKKFTCGRCFKRFDDWKTVVEHRKTHVPECDICKRPFVTGRNRTMNLLSHMFSHKNDAERKVAVAAGETGANPAKLSKKKMGKKTKRMVKKRAHARRGHQFSCSVCKRSFSQRNWLASHMRSHKEVKDPPQPVMETDARPPTLQSAVETATAEEVCNARGLMPTTRSQGQFENDTAPALKCEVIDD